jgi:hypothetical protein
VEPPGTAPGSDPLITGAFIAIVRVTPNTLNVGSAHQRRKWAVCVLDRLSKTAIWPLQVCGLSPGIWECGRPGGI